MPTARRWTASWTSRRVRSDTVRTVPYSSATSGITLEVVPAEMRAMVTTAGSKASTRRVTSA